jgi:hypothetical protein
MKLLCLNKDRRLPNSKEVGNFGTEFRCCKKHLMEYIQDSKIWHGRYRYIPFHTKKVSYRIGVCHNYFTRLKYAGGP